MSIYLCSCQTAVKVKVQSIHFNADRKLLSFIEEKVDKLRQFYEDIIDSEVFFKAGKI